MSDLKDKKLSKEEAEKVSGGWVDLEDGRLDGEIPDSEIANYIGQNVYFKTRMTLLSYYHSTWVKIIGVDGHDVYVVPLGEVGAKRLTYADEGHCAVYSNQTYNGQKCWKVLIGPHYTYFYADGGPYGYLKDFCQQY